MYLRIRFSCSSISYETWHLEYLSLLLLFSPFYPTTCTTNYTTIATTTTEYVTVTVVKRLFFSEYQYPFLPSLSKSEPVFSFITWSAQNTPSILTMVYINRIQLICVLYDFICFSLNTSIGVVAPPLWVGEWGDQLMRIWGEPRMRWIWAEEAIEPRPREMNIKI